MARASECEDEEMAIEKKYLSPLRGEDLQVLSEETYLWHSLE
jgi:hypothetical protein